MTFLVLLVMVALSTKRVIVIAPSNCAFNQASISGTRQDAGEYATCKYNTRKFQVAILVAKNFNSDSLTCDSLIALKIITLFV